MFEKTKRCLVAASVLACAAATATAQIETTTTLSSLGTPAAGVSMATGRVDAEVNEAKTQIEFTGWLKGLTSSLTAVHVHVGSYTGSVLLSINPTSTGGGSYDLGSTYTISAGDMALSSLTDAGLYFDVHTGASSSVELRGRIELPTSAFGKRDLGVIGVTLKVFGSYQPGAGTFSYDVEATGLPPLPSEAPAVAKVHAGDVFTGGPALFTLTPVGTNVWQGTSPVLGLPGKLDFLSENLYVEVTQNDQLAVRGQIRNGLLNRSTGAISVVTGGEQVLLLDAGPFGVGKLHLVLGSLTGTSPPLVLGPSVSLPLVPDTYFFLLANAPNSVVAGSFGGFDAQGEAEAVFQLPPGLVGLPVPMPVWHAYVAIDLTNPALLDFASNPVVVTIVP